MIFVTGGGEVSVRSIVDSGVTFAPASDAPVSLLLVSVADIASRTDFVECRFAFFSFDFRLFDDESGSNALVTVATSRG